MERFTLDDCEEVRKAALTWVYDREYEVVDRGSLFFVGGSKGSFKSTLARSIMAAAISGKEVAGYKYASNGKKLVLIDTEIPPHLFRRGQEDILNIIEEKKFPSNYESYRLSHIPDPIEKRREVEKFLKESEGQIDMLVLDGIGDLVSDMGNTSEVTSLMHSLIALAENTDCLIVCLAHTNDLGALLDKLGRQLERKARAGIILYKNQNYVLHIPAKETYEVLPEAELKIMSDRKLVVSEYIPFSIFKPQKIF